MCLETFGGVLRARPASTQTGSASPLASSFRIRQRTGSCRTVAKCFNLSADELAATTDDLAMAADGLGAEAVGLGAGADGLEIGSNGLGTDADEVWAGTIGLGADADGLGADGNGFMPSANTILTGTVKLFKPTYDWWKLTDDHEKHTDELEYLSYDV